MMCEIPAPIQQRSIFVTILNIIITIDKKGQDLYDQPVGINIFCDSVGFQSQKICVPFILGSVEPVFIQF